MAKIDDTSAVELLMDEGLAEEQAWAKVQDKIQQEKDEKPAPEKKEKPEVMVIVVDPDGKLPDNLEGYIVHKTPTFLDEDMDELPSGSTRKWGSSEIHSLFAAMKHYLPATKTYKPTGVASQDAKNALRGARKNDLKAIGLDVKTRVPVWIAPVGTDRIVSGADVESIEIGDGKTTATIKPDRHKS